MKISLFSKPSVIKVSFLLVVISLITSMPAQANAGFFSDLFGMTGQTAQADQQQTTSTDSNVVYNSQTLPLLESSVNPDMKNIKDTVDTNTIVGDEALSSNTGPLGPATDLEKYASSAKINVYKVKSGDTLEGIAKKFKMSKDALLYANADLKDKDLLKIGQMLVILPIKDQAPKAIVKKEDNSSAQDKVIADKTKDQNTTQSDDNSDNSNTFSINTDIPSPLSQAQNQAPTPNTTEPTTPTGQPVGTITGGYIWPFPEGTGRVSQGLHADQAYDFAAPKGTPIYAVQSGTVLIAHPTGYNGGYGLYVVINFNDGRQAIFGHMSKVVARAGDVVNQGDIIGYVGSTGHSTGPHVHIGFHGVLGNPYLGLKLNSTDLMIND